MRPAAFAALRFSTDEGMPKLLLVTSTRSTDGKSSSVLAIAQNFARRERRVLLIDSDLRKPAFKAASERVGLSKLLTTDDRVQDHILETQHQNLWLLPSGPLPPNPVDLLSTGRIRKIIAEAKESFDPGRHRRTADARPCRRPLARRSLGQCPVRHREREDADSGSR